MRFEFDAVFGPTSTQDDVYAETAPVVTSVLDGYHVCMFAYGTPAPSLPMGSAHPALNEAVQGGLHAVGQSCLTACAVTEQGCNS